MLGLFGFAWVSILFYVFWQLCCTPPLADVLADRYHRPLGLIPPLPSEESKSENEFPEENLNETVIDIEPLFGQ